MPLMNQGTGKKRYIIRSEDAKQMAGFIEKIRQDPAVEILDVIGPAEAPHTLVALMPNEKAQFLEKEFVLQRPLLIEPDQPISPLDKA